MRVALQDGTLEVELNVNEVVEEDIIQRGNVR